ncbi:hypothetical protein AALO_G00007790 [Alosa alosa]|uniref:G-protein coupled receptors family 1 profile domain-containing protein n=1 Tax=Alosa alosa TaxID=278164 RepID=A0AAV6HEN4_9TELE|nr:hypothetical protein AALO_G00007790 [Alosa alosa]
MCFINESSPESDMETLYRCAGAHYVRLYLVGESMYLLLGSPLHIYFIWLVVTQHATISKFYAMNVALCELVFSLTVVVGNSAYLSTRHHCLLYMVLPSYAFIFSACPLFQSLICMERYLAVVHPLIYLKYKTLRHKMTCTALVGVVIGGFTAAEIVYTPHFLIREFAILFVILLSIDVFCSLSVLWALKRPSPGEGEGQKDCMNVMKKSAFKTIMVIQAITFCDHIFVTVMGLCGGFSEDDWICTVDIINTFVFALCGFVQPLLYLQKMRKLPCAKERHDAESRELS